MCQSKSAIVSTRLTGVVVDDKYKTHFYVVHMGTVGGAGLKIKREKRREFQKKKVDMREKGNSIS